MPVTVAQVLHELPILSKAKVVAGSGGLDRIIRWTHIIDHPGVISWVREGHLLLTTAFSLMLHPEEQTDLIRSLNEKHLAGMMINIGQYMLEIPSDMIEMAKSLRFPLITIPWKVDLAEVTRALHEYILQEQYNLAEQANHIHKTLTQLVLDGGDLLDLARLLAEILHCSVTIEDDALQLLARSSIEPADEVRRRSIEEGKTPDNVVEFLRARGVFDHLRKNPRPYHLSPSPEIGFTLDRIVSPILVGPQLFGYIWIVASEHPLGELDYLVIERGAEVAALILSRQEAIYESEQRIKTQLFEGTLDPTTSFPLTGLPDAAWQTRLQTGYTILVIEAGPLSRRSLRQLTTLVEKQMQTEGLWATAIERGQRLAVVLGTMDVKNIHTIIERFLSIAVSKGFQVSAGISSPTREVGALRQHFQQAMDALAASSLDIGTRRVWAYEDLGFLVELLNRSPETRATNRYTDILQKIDKYDREKKTEYLLTLGVYLDHMASASQVAKILFIHRNTLYQRLSRITDLWGIDFQDPLVVLNLNIAVKDWRLHQSR